MIKRLKSKYSRLNISAKEFLGQVSATTIVRAGGMALGILISIFLGRTLGASGLGIINLSNQIAGILLMFSLLGFPTVILKEVAIAHSRKDWQHANSVINTSLKFNGLLGVFIILISYLIIPYTVEHIFKEPGLRMPLYIAVSATIFQVFSRIYASGVNGYHKIWQSSLVNDALSILVVGLSLFIQYVVGYNITVISVAWSYALARVVVTFTIGLYWKNIRQPSTKTKFIARQILKVALPLLFVQATNTIASSIDSLMIGGFLNAKAVGLYAVAIRIAFVSSFFLQVTNAVLGPKVAAMFANGQIKEMEILIQNVTKGLFILALFVFVIILVAGKYVLLIWGKEFQQAFIPLIILSVGQVVNIAAGCVVLVLTLCGQEKTWGFAILFFAVLNTVLNLIFIKVWGINGAALATATTMIILNITGIILVKKRIGILTIPIKL
jgi:O-antigen/teichoic acid export membrane protein